MNIIDFDARFTEVLNKWIEENRHRFRRPEDMEDEVPDVYLRWLNTPGWKAARRGNTSTAFPTARSCAHCSADTSGKGFLCLIRCWIGWRSWETRRR